MRIILFILSACIGCSLTAQSSKELKAHKTLVEQSRTADSGVVSLDTLFCSGKASAFIHIEKRDPEIGYIQELYVNSIVDGHVMMRVTRVQYIRQNRYPDVFFKFYFPALEQMCQVKAGSDALIYETICKNRLMNGTSLDTVNAEIFVTLKGRMDGEVPKEKQQVAEKSVVVERNRKAAFTFSGDDGENIEQGGIMIGDFKKDSTEGPEGMLRKFTVFNITGALICTATQANVNSHEWRLLTYRNNAFHSMTAATGNDLEDILWYLVNKGFL